MVSTRKSLTVFSFLCLAVWAVAAQGQGEDKDKPDGKGKEYAPGQNKLPALKYACASPTCVDPAKKDKIKASWSQETQKMFEECLATGSGKCEPSNRMQVTKCMIQKAVDGKMTNMSLEMTEASVQECCGPISLKDCEEDSDEAYPDEADPDEADPDEADPDEADPDEADPDEADPDEADPDEADPDEADPDEADPDETDPDETDPNEN